MLVGIGQLRHLLDVLRDGLARLALLATGRRDVLDQRLGLPGVRLDPAQRRNRLPGLAHAVPDLVLGVRHGRDHLRHIAPHPLDPLTDLACRVGRALGQHAHLIGHHRKTTALLTGTRGLDGGVQRQQIGLRGDLRDQANDGVDLARALAQAGRGGGRLAHRHRQSLQAAGQPRHLCRAGLGDPARCLGHLGRAARAVARHPQTYRQLLQRRRRGLRDVALAPHTVIPAASVVLALIGHAVDLLRHACKAQEHPR
ncbi:MAG: hypothetical protein DWQ11_05435 [Proteobacteria bacterium]|nr:MAG: hypothetical protein DWQ11_05435 [Pseudomonadota bacterium]